MQQSTYVRTMNTPVSQGRRSWTKFPPCRVAAPPQHQQAAAAECQQASWFWNDDGAEGDIIVVGHRAAEAVVQFEDVHAAGGHDGVIQGVDAVDEETHGRVDAVVGAKGDGALVPADRARADIEPLTACG